MKTAAVWYGVAFGLMTVAAFGGGAVVLHRPQNWALLLSVGVFCIGLVPTLEAAVDLVRLWRGDRLNERAKALALREREAALTRTAALTPARLTRLVPVNGGQRYIEMETERPARWLLWQRASEELLLWYLETGSLTSDALCGRGTRKAFGDRAAWGALLDEWQRVGWAHKENGVRTELAKGVEEIRLALTRGDVEWTLESDPPAIRACPTPPEGVLQNRPTDLKVA